LRGDYRYAHGGPVTEAWLGGLSSSFRLFRGQELIRALQKPWSFCRASVVTLSLTGMGRAAKALARSQCTHGMPLLGGEQISLANITLNAPWRRTGGCCTRLLEAQTLVVNGPGKVCRPRSPGGALLSIKGQSDLSHDRARHVQFSGTRETEEEQKSAWVWLAESCAFH
jgi:hypothetical protein